MRKISLILVILVLTAPAWADVNITIEESGDPCSYNINYEVTGADLTTGVRAFALDIYVVGGPNIVEVNDFHAGESDVATARGYGIFPSNFASDIDPEDPDWDAGGYTPLGNDEDYPDDTLDGLDTNGITVEMGALYVGETNEPLASGTLLEITLSEECDDRIMVTLNQIRGAIVLEDNSSPSADNLPYTYTCAVDCLIGGNAGPNEYADWVYFGKPSCWCYRKQCRGDSNGALTGPWPVAIPDLSAFKLAYNKIEALLPPGGICSDYDHKTTGPWRVAIPDLTIFKLYYNKIDALVPPCDSAPVITGPYNYWTTP
jgi:hypothetical protein